VFIDTSTAPGLVEVFDHFHLFTIIILFALVGLLSMLGMSLLFLFRIVEEVVVGYYRMCANCKAAARNGGGDT
jgi:hypothetical protein